MPSKSFCRFIRQPINARPAIVDPFLLDQLLLLRIVQPINQLNRALADARNCADIPHRLYLAQQMASKEYRTTGNGYRTPPISDAVFARRDDDVCAYSLDVRWQIEVVAVSDEKCLGTAGR